MNHTPATTVRIRPTSLPPLALLLFVALLAGCSSSSTEPGTDGGLPPADSALPGAEASLPGTDGSQPLPDGPPAPVGDATVPGTDASPPSSLSFVAITAGTFSMGSPEEDPCRETDETLHEVTLTRDFKLAATETTQEQFETLIGYNPAKEVACGKDCPVENMTWHEAVAFCNALSKAEGLTACYDCAGAGDQLECIAAAAYADAIAACPGYRLPTEAEWEYAYRAGTRTMYYSGDPAVCSGADATAEAIAWYNMNAKGDPHPVKLKQANAWGLYDMAGNVQEFVHDDYQKDLGAAAATDPVVPHANAKSQGVIRGGSFAHGPDDLRGAHRKPQGRSSAGTAVGFRCAISTSGTK